MNEIYEQLKIYFTNEQLFKDEPMAKHTSFKIGGKADIYINLKSMEDILNVKKYSTEKNIPLYIIGNGTNLLVRDEGIRGIVGKIELNHHNIKEYEDYAEIEVESGFSLSKLSILAMQNGYTGLEFAYGIPGTIGGAVWMNAGAYGGEMKNVVIETKYIDNNGNIKSIKGADHQFDYRKSIFSTNKFIILSTIIRLQKEDKVKIEETMNEYLKSRKNSQPLDYPNAGSTFKRGKDFITAKLIDECGLKGFSIGGAMVSEKHAGFIVNNGNASANDVLELVKYVKKVVLEKFEKEIELEIVVL